MPVKQRAFEKNILAKGLMMEKFIKILFLSFFISALPLFPASAVVSLAESLAGKILIQVQDKGQAWYVDPVSRQRAFLGRPADAFNIMRSFGLGITNANLNRIATPGQGNIDLAFSRRFAGRILLQVESFGQAWYVYPVDLKRYFLGRPADAFDLMRRLGLGITNADLGRIPVHPKFPESAPTPSPAPTPAPAPSPIPQTYNVSIIASPAFSPSALTINTGDRVIWTNNDIFSHTVTPADASLPDFGSTFLSSGQTYSYIFKKPGTYNYGCSIHLIMKGAVTVR